MNTKKLNLQKIVGIAMFASLAFVVSLIFRFPVMFLTFDAKDAIITLAGFIFGPVSALVTSLLAATIELSISDTGIYGFIMNFTSSAVFSFTASMIYKYKRTFFGSIIGFYTATAILTVTMLGMNVLVTPYFMGVERAVVIEMLPTLFLPFNLAKALMNSAISMLLYKPVITALRRAKLIKTSDRAEKGKSGFFNRFSVYTLAIGLSTLAVSIIIFVILRR